MENAVGPGPLRFDGRVAVVTGAGTGLGRAHARLLGSLGASVVVNDLRAADAETVASEIETAGGIAASSSASVATRQGANEIVQCALDCFGRLDIVVNNAGLLRTADFAEMTEDLWDEVIGVNLRGAFLVTRAAWDHMSAQRYGRIVSTTSNSGLLGTAGSTAYASAKAGLWGFTRALALEAEPLGIRVNAIAPMAYTAMSATSRIAPEAWRTGKGDAWSARLETGIVSPAMAYLAHEQCTLNGEVLSSAGGRVARFFMGLTPGFIDDDLNVDSLRAHLEDVISEDGYEVLPRSSEEGRRLHRRIFRRT